LEGRGRRKNDRNVQTYHVLYLERPMPEASHKDALLPHPHHDQHEAATQRKNNWSEYFCHGPKKKEKGRNSLKEK
jgi:hypothetical protein